MPSKLLAALASSALFVSAIHLPAQQPIPQPLQSMPYSPSLDVTSLDRSVDPCVDFYKFSCGGWQKNNPIPADQSGWSVYAKLGNENQQFLWGILEADAKATNRTPVQQKVGDYFAACMNTAAIDALGLKPVQPEQMYAPPAQPRRQVWFRVPSAAPVDEPNVHRLILAYLSDYWLSGTALLPHIAPVPSTNLVFASLDHGLWFHRYARVDDWLLYDTDSPSASCGTGISRGLIYDRAGRLIASSVQESLQRIRATTI